MANYSDIKARGKKSFANSASFPASGNIGEIIVDQATGTLHVWKGSKWDRVASGPDAGLTFTTEAQSSYVLASDGTATTVTVAASDPEGFPVTYSYDVLPANQSQATIVNNNVLSYDDASGNWKPASMGSLITIGDISDVDLSGVATGKAIIWDASLNKWIVGDAGGG